MNARIGSLFSGGGGLDLGVRSVIGGDLVWMAEHYRPARRVLTRNHPDVPLYGDIAAVDWVQVAPVDVIVAGFPCTDVSLLGKREGLRPDRSAAHLFNAPSGWDLTVRVLRATRPDLVILENVSALLTAPATAVHDDQPGSAFGAVLQDLAELGFDAEWACVDASAAGAPHRRRRVLVAAADTERFGQHPWRDGYETGRSPELGRDDATGGAGFVDGTAESWGRYRGAVAAWAGRLGRAAPMPVVNRARNGALWEWLMGLPEGWLTGAGLSTPEVQRVAGNGVVPQQVALALPALLARLTEPVAVAS